MGMALGGYVGKEGTAGGAHFLGGVLGAARNSRFHSMSLKYQDCEEFFRVVSTVVQVNTESGSFDSFVDVVGTFAAQFTERFVDVPVLQRSE